MFYGMYNEPISCEDIHVFHTQKELDDWLSYTKEQALFNTGNYIERVEIPAAVAEEMLAVCNYYDSPDGLYIKTYCRPELDEQEEPLDSKFGYYAAFDEGFGSMNIECFPTAKERDEWVNDISHDDIRVSLSRKLVRKLFESYKYFEDVPFCHAGVTLVRIVPNLT